MELLQNRVGLYYLQTTCHYLNPEVSSSHAGLQLTGCLFHPRGICGERTALTQDTWIERKMESKSSALDQTLMPGNSSDLPSSRLPAAAVMLAD